MQQRPAGTSTPSWAWWCAVGALGLASSNLLAGTVPEPDAMDGMFGSVMGTAIMVALGALAIAGVAVLAIAIPWQLRGGRNVWDQRGHRRQDQDAAWTELRRAQHQKAQRPQQQ